MNPAFLLDFPESNTMSLPKTSKIQAAHLTHLTCLTAVSMVQLTASSTRTP